VKLQLSISALNQIYSSKIQETNTLYDAVVYDTRKIVSGPTSIFFALKGGFRDGHDFITDAFEKGIRMFVVKDLPANNYSGAQFIVVQDVLLALQKLAKFNRLKYNYPVIAITGSAGKTVVKEWLSQFLQTKYNVVRSPKSYNSQLGVALSLLEMNESADVAIIEAGISKPGEMTILEDLIQPNIGVFTSFGSAHSANFESTEQHLNEKLKLFKNVEQMFYNGKIDLDLKSNFRPVFPENIKALTSNLNLDPIYLQNASLAITVAQHFGVDAGEIAYETAKLEPIALRLEHFDGVNGNLILNDTYNLDIDAFRASLEHQLNHSQNHKRVVIVGTDDENARKEIRTLVKEFEPISLHFVENNKADLIEVSNAIILVKGNRHLSMEKYAQKYRLKKHKTFIEINLNSIRRNITTLKSRLHSQTKVLAMVKASSYGSGGEKMSHFLTQIGVDYFGVAYADEGVEIRNSGVKTPILVMNAEEESFDDCIQNDLEPAIYSLKQLNSFILSVLYQGKTEYPIHLKIETGMNRLGLQEDEIEAALEIILSQPEVKIQSVYSHLSDSDNAASTFVQEQVEIFKRVVNQIKKRIHYNFDQHILNSEGCLNFPEYSFDMVRIGIAMYGCTSHKSIKLEPALRWQSAVSQVKYLHENSTVGYGHNPLPEAISKIAIIPIGYADGLRRVLSNGQGKVYINNHPCKIVGNVCMDMIMVDVSSFKINEGDVVEIIGVNQSLESLAESMSTIPYEVLTSISKRVHRIYVDN
jgi:alanine racemase